MNYPHFVKSAAPYLLVGSLFSATCTADAGSYYLGVFGGGGGSTSSSVEQVGTAFYSPPKPVVAVGSSSPSSTTAMAGAHAGFEWNELTLGNQDSGWGLRPAVEVEGFYLGGSQAGDLLSPNTPGVPNHTFRVNLPGSNGVFVANAVFGLKTPLSDSILPYVGAGVGGATMNINNANSEQLNPPEPGLNHYNSNPNASSSALAVTAKAGLRGEIAEHLSLFAEYRYVYLGSSDYTFGSTIGAVSACCPNHVPTTNWNVSSGAQNYSLGVAGIEYRF
jgi:opacity protein-like surface antigen